MADKPTRIIVDTNLWVSMAIGSRVVSAQMQQIILNSDIEIFTSIELLEELTETLAKSRLQKYLTHERTKHLFDLIWLKTKLVSVAVETYFCRDTKDDFIINLAIEANAHCIISGDEDLLVLNPINAIEILTISAFLKNLK